MTMTTGDFEYDAIFRQRTGGSQPGEVIEEIPFLPVSVILWIFFLALMPVLLQNLLVWRIHEFNINLCSILSSLLLSLFPPLSL